MKGNTGYKTRLVKEALLECPLIIPSLLKDKRFDPSITRGILYNMIPRRTSIEIESFGSIFNDYVFEIEPIKFPWQTKRQIDDTSKNQAKIDRYFKELSKKLDLLSFSRDNTINEYTYSFIEHKISIKDYTQAPGLYKALELMKEHCELNMTSGCHIHVDISHLTDLIKSMEYEYRGDFINNFFNNYLKVNPISDIFGPYDGSFMTTMFDINDKHAQVTLRTNYQSVEFRTAPMTFDYNTIIKWFIACNKIINQFGKALYEKKVQMNSIKYQKQKKYAYYQTLAY